MQLLYMESRHESFSFNDLLRHYTESVNRASELYLFNLLFFIRIAQYSIHDGANRRSKLRPSAEDKTFKPKLGENDLIYSITNNSSVEARFLKLHLANKIERDNVRLLYTEFLKGEEYKSYLNLVDSTAEDDQNILLELYKFCSTSEIFNELMEDYYATWIDDKSLIVGAMKKTIKILPAPDDFYKEYLPDEETTKFGQELLRFTYFDKKELMELIEPVLKNWDADRVAVIDMILLKMALVEMLHFPTIPTKVTLNEFVEISKLYSTDKSKDFINGILDRLMKQLYDQGKITKEGRGLIT